MITGTCTHGKHIIARRKLQLQLQLIIYENKTIIGEGSHDEDAETIRLKYGCSIFD